MLINIDLIKVEIEGNIAINLQDLNYCIFNGLRIFAAYYKNFISQE